MMRFCSGVKIIAAFAVLVLLSSTILFGQGVTGSILGRVTDTTGAVIAGAMIQVQNAETGLSQTAQSDEEGRYLIRNLPPGAYDVTVTQLGFQTQVQRRIALTVASEVTVNAELAVGNVAERVEVTAAPAAIETTNATISGLVTQDQMRDLPLNGRSLDQLVLLNPGVFVSRYTQNVSTLGRGMRISVNGGRQDANVYLIDGAVTNDHAANGPNSAGGAALGVEGILEYRVLTHNFSAEYGRNSGGVVSMVTRSGTNAFHGSAYEFLRNKVFDARNFYNQDELPPFQRNQFGAAFGGPIKKDRMFFFVNYEGLRQRQGRTFVSTVPDANARNGLVPCTAAPTAPCNTSTNLASPPLNPASLPYLRLYPVANGRVFGDGTAQAFIDLSVPTNEDYRMGRVDYRISDKDNFYIRYIASTGTSSFPRPGAITADLEGGGYHFASLSEAHIFSPNSVNDFRFAFNRTDPSVTSVPIGNWDPKALGFVAGLPFGGITYSSGNQGGGGGSGASQQLSGVELRAPDRRFTQNIYQVDEALSYNRGAHALKFGAHYERIQLNFPSGTAGGTYQFQGLLQLIAGTPQRFTFSPQLFTPAWRRNLFAWYIQDDFRVSPRLTINLGLRHEFLDTPVEINGRSGNLIDARDTAITPGPPFISSKKNFSPRVGLAWDPTGSGKTSIRAGAGIYYNFVDGRTWYMGSGTTQGALFSNSINIGSATAPPPWPRIDPKAFANAPRSTYSFGFNNLLKEPTVIHYNFDIQQELPSAMTLGVGYIGTRGYRMGRLVAENVRIPSTLPDGRLLFPATGPVVNPNFQDISGLYTDAHSSYNGLQTSLQKRLSAGLTFTINYTWSKAMSDADEVGNAQSNGVAPTTLDRTNLRRDWSLSTFDQRHTLVLNGRYQFPWDSKLKSGLAKGFLGGWFINGIFNASSGQPFNINTGFNNSRNNDPLQSDRPDLAPGFSNNPTSGVTAGCPGVAAGQKLGTPDLWFDPCAFVLQTPGTFGNLGRNTVIAPGFQEFNFTLAKNTVLREGTTLEFRAEVFNVLNHANFTLPARTVYSNATTRTGGAGVIGSTQGNNRQIQFGLKLNF
ncbi:MAG TPA: TonB-dependent receptor [Terriglobia bacterium]|nr:TonB-dependent receptor [Terriglobia bacterium]